MGELLSVYFVVLFIILTALNSLGGFNPPLF